MIGDDTKKLVLHIGAHKTGTSAIQIFLQRANVQLNSQGWAFAPQPEGAINWSPMIGMSQTADGGTFHLRDEVYPTFLRRIRGRKRHLIVSSEDLFFLERDQTDRLATDLASIAPDITIVAYLRRQDRMALSQWAQGGKTIQSAAVFGCQTSPLRPLTDQMRSYLDYDARLSQWQSAFPKARIVARVYDRDLFPNGDVVQDFVALLGLQMPDVEVPKDVNAAFGSDTVQFYYWLRAQGFQQGEIRAIIQRHVIEDTRERTLPARAEVAEFLAAFHESNARLAARLGVDQPFDTDLSDYPETSSFAPLSDDFKLRNLLALTMSLREGLKP